MTSQLWNTLYERLHKKAYLLWAHKQRIYLKYRISANSKEEMVDSYMDYTIWLLVSDIMLYISYVWNESFTTWHYDDTTRSLEPWREIETSKKSKRLLKLLQLWAVSL